MTTFLRQKIYTLYTQQAASKETWKPLFYRIYNTSEQEAFTQLLDTPGLIISDCILGQLKELMKISHPSRKLTDSEQEQAALQHIKGLSLEEYGVWVYYPWSNRLVHIVDEQEFIDLRTSRNQYKITREERELLAQKKIGVIGLSVGQSVSVTLAMERIGGELRLADFDVLELTNLNRIRTGIHNLGLPKVYAVAREIAEIDPFLTVKCFAEGLSDSNMDAFFTEGGKLDLLIEESDGFDIKILSRYKAKSLQIPVVMEASDRCTVDVERFDLEPTREILHGLVNHLNVEILKTLKTTEDKIPYLLDMVGLETSSDRLKASLLEIDQTITTWPQLASSVTMGGGITADVSRRVLLNTYTESGRYFVDVEELIGNQQDKKKSSPVFKQPSIIDFKRIARHLTLSPSADQKQLSSSEVEQLVTAGCTAPSGGNAQPWRWVYKSSTLLLFKAFDDSSALLGFDNLSSFVALGAASENILLKANELFLDTQYTFLPDPQTPDLIAAFTFTSKKTREKTQLDIASAIDKRITNRKLGERILFSEKELELLKEAAQSVSGAQLTFFTKEKDLDAIGNILGEIEKIRLLEKKGHQDFIHEIRWTAKEAEDARDGVDLRTIELTNAEMAGFKVSKNDHVIELVSEWEGGGAFKKLTKKSIDASGAVGFLYMPDKSKQNYFNGGRALQRIWLTATQHNISLQPMASSLFLYERILSGNKELLSEEGYNKLLSLRPLFEKTFNIDSSIGELFIFRISKVSQPEIKSLRKSLHETYCNLENES